MESMQIISIEKKIKENRIFLVILFLSFCLLFFPQNSVRAGNVEINMPVAEYAFMSPGPEIIYSANISYIGAEPEYVRVYVGKIGEDSAWQGYSMAKEDKNEFGTSYSYTKNFSASEIGYFGFYYEVKQGGEITKSYTNPGPKIASADIINNQYIYLLKKGKSVPLWSYSMGKKWTTSLAFSEDGQYMAAATNKRKLYFFNTDSNEPSWIFKGKKSKKPANTDKDKGLVAISDNGYMAATIKGWIYLFDLNSDTPKKPVWKRWNGKSLYGLKISDDAEYIAAAGRAGRVYLWSQDAKKPMWTKRLSTTTSILDLDMTPDGKYVTVGMDSSDNRIYVFNTQSAEPFFNIKAGNDFPVHSVAISDNGQYLMAAGGQGSDQLEYPYASIFVKVGETTPAWTFGLNNDPTLKAAISPSGHHAVVGFQADGMFVLEDTHGPGSTKWWLKDSGYLGALEYSDNGQYLAAGSGTNHVFLVRYDGSAVYNDWTLGNKIESIAITEDGQYIAAGTGLYSYANISNNDDFNNCGTSLTPVSDPGPELIDFDNFSFTNN